MADDKFPDLELLHMFEATEHVMFESLVYCLFICIRPQELPSGKYRQSVRNLAIRSYVVREHG